jgi:hypothetical protein
MPDLDFKVVAAEAIPYAAVPTLQFTLAVTNEPADEQIQAIMLRVQMRIDATQRSYDVAAQALLRELFGEPAQWAGTLRSLLWTNTTMNVPPFTGSIAAELPIACSYDFDIVGTKYLAALEDGDIPLLFLFSGTVLYASGATGLQITQIPWEKEAAFRLPVRLWREMMDRYFPNSVWLRVRKDLFDRLYRYKGRNALLTWEDVFERLLTSEVNGSFEYGDHRGREDR